MPEPEAGGPPLAPHVARRPPRRRPLPDRGGQQLVLDPRVLRRAVVGHQLVERVADLLQGRDRHHERTHAGPALDHQPAAHHQHAQRPGRVQQVAEEGQEELDPVGRDPGRERALGQQREAARRGRGPALLGHQRVAQRAHEADVQAAEPVDDPLPPRHDHQLGQVEDRRQRRQQRLDPEQVGEGGEDGAALEQRHRQALGDEAGHVLGLGRHHRDQGAALARAAPAGERGGVDEAAQLEGDGLDHPAAAEVEPVLQPALEQDGGQVGEAEQGQQAELPPADRLVGDPPLQLERHHRDRHDQEGHQAEPDLVRPGRGPDEAVDREGARRGRPRGGRRAGLPLPARSPTRRRRTDPTPAGLTCRGDVPSGSGCRR